MRDPRLEGESKLNPSHIIAQFQRLEGMGERRISIHDDSHGVITTANPQFSAALEVLLKPGLLVAAVVHATVRVPSGHAVPLGLLSFDPLVVLKTSSPIAWSLTNSPIHEIAKNSCFHYQPVFGPT